MSKISTKPPSGMRDFLGPALRQRRFVVDVIQSVFESYGFEPLETPTIENLTTLLGKYGDEGDQLLYRVLHRRDKLARALQLDETTETDLADLGLRYDLTVPLARVLANYPVPRFYKRYQIQPVWRADRPAKGRYREFYQCDVDITGSTGRMAEAEVCNAVAEVLDRLQFGAFTIQLNDRRLLRAIIAAAGIASDDEGTALVAVDKLDKVGEDGVLEELSDRGISADAARSLLTMIHSSADELRERVGESATIPLNELEEIIALCKNGPAGSHLKFAPALARGLGYYTGAIFEITAPDVKGSLGGGGRYDELVGMFGKQTVPAVGFSLGLERLLLLMDEKGLYPDLPGGPDLMLCWLDADPAAVLGVAAALRGQGLRVDVYPQSAKLKKQLQYASESAGAGVAGIVGANELAAGEITLKDLTRGEQATVRVDAASQTLATWSAQSAK